MRKAFTLIELLVTVSIIALVIALLLPALTRTKRSALRAECSSNLKQMADANYMIAVGRDMFYPLSNHYVNKNQYESWRYYEISMGGWDHTTWINYSLFDHYIEYGVEPSRFTCPNRVGDEYIWRHGSWGWRLGYYVQSGREQLGSSFTYNGRQWASPVAMEDVGPQLVIMSDINERNTGTPRGSSFSHGPEGLITLYDTFVTPQEGGAEGGFSALSDGSVTWVSAGEMGAFAAHNGGIRQGFWYDSPSYEPAP